MARQRRMPQQVLRKLRGVEVRAGYRAPSGLAASYRRRPRVTEARLGGLSRSQISPKSQSQDSHIIQRSGMEKARGGQRVQGGTVRLGTAAW